MNPPYSLSATVGRWVAAALFGFGSTIAAWAAASRPHNIVFILADDMGWNQVGYHGSTWYETPNIDRIAREGMQFRHAYAAAPICSPTRAALMTGKAPARLHLTDFIPGARSENKPLVTPVMRQGLPLEEATIPEMLRTRGYVSGIFGKWHLAPDYNYTPGRPMDPESQGFDEVFHSSVYVTIKDAHDKHGAIATTDRAVDFIERHKDKPFFCYVSHNVVHAPLGEEPELVAKYKAKPGADLPQHHPVMGAMIETMDRTIGRLLETLERLNLAERTIVVFTSDNGNIAAQQSQMPWRGGKSMLWEGGVRVPLAVRWPGIVRPGGSSDEPVIIHDWFNTIMEIAGVAYQPDYHDGASLMPLFTGKATTLGREALYWHYPHYHSLGGKPSSSVRAGRYKLIEWHEGALLGGGPAVSLFDLIEDPGEARDLAGEKPDLASELRAKLRAWRKHVDAQEMKVREPASSPRK